MSSKVERYLERASDDLPAMPKIASQVVRAVDDPNSSLEDVRKLIDQDADDVERVREICRDQIKASESIVSSTPQPSPSASDLGKGEFC